MRIAYNVSVYIKYYFKASFTTYVKASFMLKIILTIGLTIYGLASFQDNGQLEGLESSKGWRKFTSGFFIGSLGGAVVAYLLLNNIAFFN